MTTLKEVGGKDSIEAEADGWGFAIGTMSGVIARVTTKTWKVKTMLKRRQMAGGLPSGQQRQ